MSTRATPDDVRYAYRLLLGREPDEAGYRHFCTLVDESAPTVAELARLFMASREFAFVHGELNKLDKGTAPEKGVVTLVSQACTQRQIETPVFRYWANRMHERPGGLHRKLWEWCFISQALYERGMLASGKRGLGFAVGNEPMTSLFAQLGCEILASDLDSESAGKTGWVESNQHASGLAQLNARGLCAPDLFAERVRFRAVDMRAIDDDLRGFDFLWSSCALEHLGSLQHGLDFVMNAMDCLRPGGVAVHTTELNCDSDVETVETGDSVVYRQRDLRELAERLQAQGHMVAPFDFDLGYTEADRYVDEYPYRGPMHLKLRIGPYASTSFGLIVTKQSNAN